MCVITIECTIKTTEMGRVKKNAKKPKTSTENLLKKNLREKNIKFKKKVPIYNIIDDSIVEPNNSNVVYSDEDDSFHEIKPKTGSISENTSTPLKPKAPKHSPKLLFKCLNTGNLSQSVKLDRKKSMRKKVSDVSNMLSNVSVILQQISDSNKSFSNNREGSAKDENLSNENSSNEIISNVKPKIEEINISFGENNLSKNENSIVEQKLDNSKIYTSQLQVNLSTNTKNITATKTSFEVEKTQVDNSKIEYDSFLQEFYIKANPHVIENNTKEMSWEQFSENEKFDLSDMVKIDPNLEEFISAPGSTDEKMKYLILKLGELAEQNETLKKHVEWLSDQYNKQNIELEKQFLPMNHDIAKNIEEKNPEELLREYYILHHKYNALNNHLDDALRHKESYKKALVLSKSEKDALEKDLINLNEFDDDRERMNELLNIQSDLRLDLKNSTDRNTGLRHDIKTLNEENYRLRHELSNAHRKITELKHINEKQKQELENLQEICNLQQKDLNTFSKDKDIDFSALSYNNSKSWIEQVLDEEKYSDSNSQHESTDISLESVSTGDLNISTSIPFENDPVEVSDTEKIEENYFYRKNFFVRPSSLESKYFQSTSDPIKVKLRSKNHNTICKYFMRNNCRFAENCLFLHPKQPIHPPHVHHYKNRSPPNNYHRSTASPQNQRNPHFRLQATPNQRSFQTHNKPDFQVRNFPNSPVRETPYPSENYEREYRSYGRNTWNPHRNETCFYFMRGVCRYGSGCHFYHPPPKNSPLSPYPQH